MTSRTGARLAVALTLTVVAGCGRLDIVDVLGPMGTSPGLDNRLSVFVQDDSRYLNSTLCCSNPLVGARVEILDGPAASRSATTDARGIATFTNLGPEAVRVRATFGDYEPEVLQLYPSLSFLSGGDFYLGRGTHVLSGSVRVLQSPVAGARVDITDGPNAGRFVLTGDDGVFRFHDLVTSPRLTLICTKPGYVAGSAYAPQAVTAVQFTHNEWTGCSLTPAGQ